MRYKAKKLLALLMTMIMALQMLPTTVAYAAGFFKVDFDAPNNFSGWNNGGECLYVVYDDGGYKAKSYGDIVQIDNLIAVTSQIDRLYIKSAVNAETAASESATVVACYPDSAVQPGTPVTGKFGDYDVSIEHDNNTYY